MRSPAEKPTRVFVVTPDGRILATHYGQGVTSHYVDAIGRIRPRAESEGFRLLSSFSREAPGFLPAFTAYHDAAERGEVEGDVVDEHLPPSIVKLRQKAAKTWKWPTMPAKKGAKQ
jgi:hypothetical protein